MATQKNTGDRIALLQGTLDLLILKTRCWGRVMARAWRDRTNASLEEVFVDKHTSLYRALCPPMSPLKT